MLPANKLNYECLKVVVVLNYTENTSNIKIVAESQENGKTPRLVLASSSSKLDDSTAISCFISGRNSELFGEDGSTQSAQIYDWVFLSDGVLHPNITTWISPYLGLVMYNKQDENIAMNKVDEVMK